MTIQFPSSYATSEWVRELQQRPDVDVVIPHAFALPQSLTESLPSGIARGTDRLVHTLLLVAGDDFSLHYYHPDRCSWTEFRQVTLANTIGSDVNHLYERDIVVFDEDTTRTNEVVQALGEHVTELYGQPVFAYDQESAQTITGMQRSPATCPHPETIPLQVEILDHPGVPVLSCRRCGQPHMVKCDGQTFDRDGVLNRLLPDAAVHVREDRSTYRILKAKPGENDAVDALVAFLTQEIEAELAVNATPAVDESVLFLEVNDVIVGYAVLGQLRDEPSLQQLYVIPEARENGYAKVLLSRWIQEFGDGETFYVDRPNEAGKAVLSSLGLLNDDGLSAVPYRMYNPMIIEPTVDTPVLQTIQDTLN
ncbi:GNAT family N-acetyltransferase [Halomicrobium salinisoli]|uniref:GNAT family N-acetyltransferase n=1 Tax=Halomicrobium salinisoli TaxID=2878391 RepID=UPI001CF05CCD|nr:GNAT family N-acetyltransferase [Halomicrobium salinisoli]